MLSRLFAMALAALCTACALSPNARVAATANALNAKPLGWTCSERRPVRLPAAAAWSSTHSSLLQLRVRPDVADSAAGRILVDGAKAPNGAGTALQQRAKLYLLVLFEPTALPGVTDVTIAPGVSSAPAGITPNELKGLYEQAYALAQSVADRANLFHLSCLNQGS